MTYLTFRAVEEYLPAQNFIRTHKSYIVAMNRVDAIEGNDLRVGDHLVPVMQPPRSSDESADRGVSTLNGRKEIQVGFAQVFHGRQKRIPFSVYQEIQTYTGQLSFLCVLPGG